MLTQIFHVLGRRGGPDAITGMPNHLGVVMIRPGLASDRIQTPYREPSPLGENYSSAERHARSVGGCIDHGVNLR